MFFSAADTASRTRSSIARNSDSIPTDNRNQDDKLTSEAKPPAIDLITKPLPIQKNSINGIFLRPIQYEIWIKR